MAKISNEAKNRYFEKIKDFKVHLDEIAEREKEILATLEEDEETLFYKKIDLAQEALNMVSYFVLMNSLSTYLLGVKNEAYLNTARKGCYKSIIYLEDVVSPFIDSPFSDYEERLSKIEKLSEEMRYSLLRKLGLTIQLLIDGFGENSKWKWSFVELDGRFATISKNMLDMKSLLTNLDPRADHYEATVGHLSLAKSLLQKAADRYRQKYELSTLRIDDFKLAIRYLGGLRRLHIVLGESEESEALKKKIEIWRSKMETDSKKKDQRSNPARKK